MDHVKEWCKKARDTGAKVGVGTHKPEVTRLGEDEGWDVDFYAGCVYNRTRTAEEWKKVLGGELLGDASERYYLQSDPPRMYKVHTADEKALLCVQDLGGGRIADRELDQAFRRLLKASSPPMAFSWACFPGSRTKCERTPSACTALLSAAVGLSAGDEDAIMRRRTFLGAGLGRGRRGAAVSCGRTHVARSRGASLATEEARTVDAICEQLIPAGPRSRRARRPASSTTSISN